MAVDRGGRPGRCCRRGETTPTPRRDHAQTVAASQHVDPSRAGDGDGAPRSGPSRAKAATLESTLCSSPAGLTRGSLHHGGGPNPHSFKNPSVSCTHASGFSNCSLSPVPGTKLQSYPVSL